MKSKPIALSFFSGAMGMDQGLEESGFDVRLACENEKHCRQTIALNRPNLPLLGDVNECSRKSVLKAAGLRARDAIDLVVGGPPCQAFSTAGKRKAFQDLRGNVFLKFIDLAIELKPKFIVIENVRGLLSCPLAHRPHDKRGSGFPDLANDELKGGALNYVLALIRRSGYAYSFNLYNAANFGTPQVRERVIIVCSRDKKVPPFLTPTHFDFHGNDFQARDFQARDMHGSDIHASDIHASDGQKNNRKSSAQNGNSKLLPWNTFRSATKGLRKHHHLEFPEKRLKYYRLLKPGQNWKNLPTRIQKQAMGKSFFAGGGKTGFYRRLDWDRPSPTLVTHPAMPATDLAHPTKLRPLSIEEYKRLQEFPDDWKIAGSMIQQYRQLGNAVPVSLGAAVGRLIKQLLNGKAPKPSVGFKFSRYRNTSHVEWESEFEKICEKASIDD